MIVLFVVALCGLIGVIIISGIMLAMWSSQVVKEAIEKDRKEKK